MGNMKYIRFSRAWYFEAWESREDEVTVQIHDDGRFLSEFTIQQVGDIGVKLGVFDEAMPFSDRFAPLIGKLGDTYAEQGELTLDDVEDACEALGWEDVTEEEIPQHHAADHFARVWSTIYPKGETVIRDHLVEVRGHEWWEEKRVYEPVQEALEALKKYDEGWGAHPAGDVEVREALAPWRVEAADGRREG